MHDKPEAESSRKETHTPVAVVGAGPVGLALALGLARYGVRSVLVEKNATTSRHSKAAGVHLRTREIFQQWGIEERFLQEGMLVPVIRQHNAAPGRGLISEIDFSDLETEAARPGVLMLEQSETERLLLEALEETRLSDIRFNTQAVELSARSDGVTLIVCEEGSRYAVEADYVVGCDGASSFVRNALELPFEGITYELRPMLADVRIEDERDDLPWPRVWNGRDGITAGLRLRPGLWRIVRLEGDKAEKGVEVSEAEVARRVEEVLGEGPVDVVWSSRFRIHKRASPRFRVGRVLLAGDAAHVHSPAGGLGMNAGVQDAHNLAWKLAFALQGGDEDRLLDSYDTERRAVVVEEVSRFTDLITRLFLQSPTLVREMAFVLFRSVLKIGPIRRRILRRMTMIDLDYPASPLIDTTERAAGRRLPNPLLVTPDGRSVRLYDLLPVDPVLLCVGDEQIVPDDLPASDIIRIGHGGYRDSSGHIRDLLGSDDGWILVRPDAHVAWAVERVTGGCSAAAHALGLEMQVGS